MFPHTFNPLIPARAVTASSVAKAVSWLANPLTPLRGKLLAVAGKGTLMKTPTLARNLFLLFALASPAVLPAQLRPPTPEELKMTDDPKAPGAAAVYLNIEETTNDELHFMSAYARIKVLEEKGKELATVEIPYWRSDFKVINIQARTIHSDGTIIPLAGKPDDLMTFKTTNKEGEREQVNTMVFTLPSVEVGSILEYYFELRYDEHKVSSPRWEIQKSYFVHNAHFAFTPYQSFLNGPGVVNAGWVTDEHGDKADFLHWWPTLPPGTEVKKDAKGRYTVDATDVPPMPKEDWMPPVGNFRYRVFFYYLSTTKINDFWTDEFKRWSKDVDHFAEPTNPIKDAVGGLVAPGDSDLDKAKKLYKAVQALDNTKFSRKKSESEQQQLKLKTIKRAEDTWAQKSGSSEDIALLYLAMLRAVGLTANAMKVVDRQRGVFDRAYLRANQLDDTIVVLNIAGKEITLDPGEKMCPFQTVSWRHSSAAGFLQGSDGKDAKTSPGQAAADNKLSRAGDITLDAQGNATGTLRFSITGQAALHWRQIALRNDEDEVRKQFHHWVAETVPQGIEAHIDHFEGLDDPDVNLVAIVNVKGALGTATSKRLLFPGFFFETRASHPFVDQEKRMEPVDMHYGEIVGDQITYHLPAGFAVEGAPPDASISWPDHAICVTRSLASPDQIIIARKLARGFTFASQKDYQDLRGFYQKVAAADQGQLVLTSATPKGN